MYSALYQSVADKHMFKHMHDQYQEVLWNKLQMRRRRRFGVHRCMYANWKIVEIEIQKCVKLMSYDYLRTFMADIQMISRRLLSRVRAIARH